MVKVAVAGAGSWGRNLVRNFHQLPGAELAYVCDTHEERLSAIGRSYPGVVTTTEYRHLLDDPALEAVAIATTAATHYALCRSALEAGKDVFVEKPFVLAAREAEELIALAGSRERILMVGHLLEYHPVVLRLKALLEQGELGEIQYVYSQRLNLGTVRPDENALWSFAPHDVSVILYLLGREPVAVSAHGQSYLQPGIQDVVFLTLHFADRTMAHVHVSWLDPHKVRRMTLVGRRKMAVFDDLQATEKLRIYDKGAAYQSDYETYAEYVGLRFGDISIPYIKVGEPLRLECEHFLDCVAGRRQPRSDGADGLRVVRILEAAQRSLDAGGAPVALLLPPAGPAVKRSGPQCGESA